MKIENSNKSGSLGSSTSVTGGASRLNKGTSNAASTSGSSGARVQLSQLASQLHAVESSMADTPVVDGARVSEIRRAIADGSFKVNSDMVADRLIQTARELMRVRYA